MRAHHALVLACIATLACTAAAAQTQPRASLSADLSIQGSSHLEPGQGAGVTLMATRSCANQAQVLPAGTLQVHVVGSSGAVAVTGATSVAMDQLICAQMQRQTVRLTLNATARTDLGNFTTIDETIVFQLHTDAGDQVNPPPADAVVSTLFVVEAPQKAASVGMNEDVKPTPPAGVEVAIGLLGLVAAARRRLA